MEFSFNTRRCQWICNFVWCCHVERDSRLAFPGRREGVEGLVVTCFSFPFCPSPFLLLFCALLPYSRIMGGGGCLFKKISQQVHIWKKGIQIDIAPCPLASCPPSLLSPVPCPFTPALFSPAPCSPVLLSPVPYPLYPFYPCPFYPCPLPMGAETVHYEGPILAEGGGGPARPDGPGARRQAGSGYL